MQKVEFLSNAVQEYPCMYGKPDKSHKDKTDFIKRMEIGP